jgi:stage III sporulation protein AH
VKTFRRNAVIITVLLFVCVAAYLNWSYNKNADDTLTAAEVSSATENAGQDAGAEASDPGLYYDASALINKEYFDTARLNRQQARDAAAAALATVSQTEGASQEMIDAALQEISDIASDSIKEAELEALIIAKGFADCVVYISDEGVSITVPAPEEGLPASSIARITDVVTAQTEYKAADMKIIEVK